MFFFIQVSLSGVTEDETTTDPREARRKLRQRAEIARGRRDDESPKYDRHNFKNGQAGGRRDREYSEEVSDDEPIARGRPDPHHHTNGGYKYSDESQDHTERDSEDESIKKQPIDDSDEEDDQRNSFTPVKFKPNVEKELDSIQMNPNGSIQFRRQDESGSVDMSGRQLSRSMSSFSAHDAQQDKGSNSSRGSDLDAINLPTPPPSLPLNIPAKPNTPVKPQPRPVPAPRPKPLPSARSFGSKEDLAEVKLNNLSQDEVSDYRGSRERLDNMYSGRKVPSRENLNTFSEPYKRSSNRSHEDLTDTGLGVGVDFLPRPDKGVVERDEGRDSPLHTSRENLLPKRSDSDNYKPPVKNTRENIYKPDLYDRVADSSREPLYPYQRKDPGVEYMGRQTPQNTDFNDGTGIDYLPRDTRTPMKSRFMIGQLPNSPTSQSPRSPYQPTDTGNMYTPSSYPTPYHDDSVRYQPDSYQPRYPSSSENVPYHPPSNTGVDYLPRSNYTPASQNRDMSRSRENISRSRENLSRSRENLSRSRDNLRFNSETGPSTYNNDLRENSTDIVKPRQQKSIETEI